MSYEIVIPTSGRDSLAALLDAIGPEGVIVVDDRRDRAHPLPLGAAVPALSGPASAAAPGAAVRVIAGPGRGPAAARNAGWRAARAEWVVFLDDDVLPPAGWREALAADLAAAGPDVAATQGRIVVPVSARPTDWERNVVRPRARPLGDRRHGLPPGGPRGCRRLRRTLPTRLPRGRRPRPARDRRRLADRRRRPPRRAPRPPGRSLGLDHQAGGQRRRRPDAPPPRPRLARARGRPARPSPAPPGDHSGRSRRPDRGRRCHAGRARSAPAPRCARVSPPRAPRVSPPRAPRGSLPPRSASAGSWARPSWRGRGSRPGRARRARSRRCSPRAS